MRVLIDSIRRGAASRAEPAARVARRAQALAAARGTGGPPSRSPPAA
jgi:hypothetical protein